MSNISVKWYSTEPNILLISLDERGWTVEELVEAMTQANQMIEDISAYVTLVDTTPSAGYLPPNMLAGFSKLARHLAPSEKDKGTVVISGSHYNKTISDIFSRVMRRLDVVNTFEAGLEMAQKRLQSGG